MKIIHYFGLAFLILLTVTACKKSAPSNITINNDDTNTTAEVDAYTCGNVTSASLIPQATVWKNNVPMALSTGPSEVFAITSQGKDVYVVGDDQISSCYWKNGTRISVTDEKTRCLTRAIAVQGNDVYTAGTLSDSGFGTAAYWKNGIMVNLTSPAASSEATGIAIKGNDVYVCGDYLITSSLRRVACYWKNGIITTLVNDVTKYSTTKGIIVNGTDVYIAVNTQSANYDPSVPSTNRANYWKNGQMTQLSDISSFTTGISINGNDIYVSGGESALPYKTSYWKNGVPMNFPGIIGSQAIAIHGNDVYLAGFESSGSSTDLHATYWKNGVITHLNQTLISVAYGITLVPQ